MPETDSSLDLENSLLFTWIFLLFIMSWITVAVIGRAIDNFTFTTLKLDSKSTYHTTVIAVVIFVIEVFMVYYFKSLGITIYDTDCIKNDESINMIGSISGIHNIEII